MQNILTDAALDTVTAGAFTGGTTNNTMLMFGMALALRNRAAGPVFVNFRGGCRGGFSWHARW